MSVAALDYLGSDHGRQAVVASIVHTTTIAGALGRRMAGRTVAAQLTSELSLGLNFRASMNFPPTVA
jgi:hypothetical protein